MNKHSAPPRFAKWLLQQFCAPHILESIEGDLYELFDKRVKIVGIKKARLLFIRDVLLLMRPTLLKKPTISPTLPLYSMLSNYLKITLRNLLMYKGFSFINIIGLSIGIASSLLILLYIQDELNFDRHHERAEDIYRVVGEYKQEGREIKSTAKTPFRLATILQTDFPQIEKIARIRPASAAIKYGEKKFQEDKFFFADSSFFDIFSVSFIEGNPKRALQAPLSVVITEEIAQKYFGKEDPMGKSVEIFGMTFTITGITSSKNLNAHFSFDLLASMSNPVALFGDNALQQWGETGFYTYFLLKPGQAAAHLQAALPALIQKHAPQRAPTWRVQLQPLTSIHLHSNLNGEIEANGNITTIRIFAILAFFILLIASINFINLATARSAKRAKEVGIRKVLGAQRGQIMQQFFGEILLLVSLSLLVALALAHMVLPDFNTLAEKSLSISYLNNWLIGTSLLAMMIFICVLAGSYPAIVFSSFQPIQVLKGMFKANAKNLSMRNGLVVLQFSISIVLIIATFIVNSQLAYVTNTDYGFHKEHLLMMSIPGGDYQTAKNAMLQVPGVLSVASSSKDLPLKNTSSLVAKAEGVAENRDLSIQVISVDNEYFKTIGATIIEGRDFSKRFPTDLSEGYILNEAAVKMIGWQSAVGKKFSTDEPTQEGWKPKPGRVIGVVKDFHNESLHKQIEPTAFYITPLWFSRLIIRTSAGNLTTTLAELQKKWKVLSPDAPFTFNFVDEDFSKLYQKEAKLSQVINYFSILIIFISCLGLLGLSTFMAEQRRKEIGIRKVLGATAASILSLLFKDFGRLVVVATLIAWPIAWYFLNSWLEDFAYRIEMSGWVFLLAGMIALSIAFVTISFQAVKAALTNPVTSLRNE